MIVVVAATPLGCASQEFFVTEDGSLNIGLRCFGLADLLDLIIGQNWSITDRTTRFGQWKQPLDEVMSALPLLVSFGQYLIQPPVIRVNTSTFKKSNYHLCISVLHHYKSLNI